MLKVNLIVVSGKPEGKVIPLTVPTFRIGRDESCNLKPNSVEVSRQHSEITVTDTDVIVKDLGSRNGTFVNGTLLTAPHRLKSGELLKVGPLTFAVSIQEPAGSAAQAAPSPSRPAALGGSQPQVEAWLVADNTRPTPDRPSGVYDGDTLTIDAYTGAGGQVPNRPAAAKPASNPAQPVKPASNPAQPVKPPSRPAQPVAPPAPEPEPVPDVLRRAFDDDSLEFERLEEGAGDPEEEAAEAISDEGEGEAEDSSSEEEFLDVNNPFYVPKKAPAAAQKEDPKASSYKDTSDAANDILRRMIDRRRASR